MSLGKDYERHFSDIELKKICEIIANTNTGLTGSEIEFKLRKWKIEDVSPDLTK